MPKEFAQNSLGGDVVKLATTEQRGDAKRGYSWSDVAKHNKKGDAWVVYRGFVYDVTAWVDRHPGGMEQILLCAGRDVTDLVAMYHPFAMEKVDKYFASWEKLGPCTESEYPVFKADSGFYKELSADIANFFEKQKLDSKDWRYGAVRMVPVALAMAWSYCVMNGIGSFATDSWAVLACAALVFGWAQAMPLLHVMHDSCHTAFGHNETLWQWAGRVPMDWIAGSSILSWQHQHVVGHHVYTNLYESDPDLPQGSGDARRLSDRQAWGWVYKWQWIYLPLLYSTLGMKMRYDDVFEVYMKGKDGPVRVNWFDSPIWRVWVTKSVWAAWRIALPLAVLGVDPWRYWALFALAEAVTGWYLALNFQVSHISVDAEFPLNKDPVEDPKMKQLSVEWAENQVRTSVNYVGGLVPDYLCGALNYQIEHHLFPGVSQYHYPAIAPIVRQHCERNGLPYNCRSGFLDALSAHLQYLHKMGQEGTPVGMH